MSATFIDRVRGIRRPPLHTSYADELRLLPTRTLRIASLVLFVTFLGFPFMVGDFVLTVLVITAIFMIGALGLNILTGFAGQVSVGHAAFMGTGAYAAVYFGGKQGYPLPVWIIAAAVIGAVVGMVIGPFALRLRGLYLAFVSVGMVFVGIHIFTTWKSLTGGVNGVAVNLPAAIGPVDFNALTMGSTVMTKPQSWFWLTWIVVVICAVLSKNVMRSRPGRAMQAIRDRDQAAAVIGISLARYKIAAFAISGALGAVAGSLYVGFIGYVNPDEWDLLLSIQFITIMVIGGTGTIYGMALGSLFIVGVPRILEQFSDQLGFIDAVGLTVSQLNLILFGTLLVTFLVFEPLGMAAMWQRVRAYFTSWPYRY